MHELEQPAAYPGIDGATVWAIAEAAEQIGRALALLLAFCSSQALTADLRNVRWWSAACLWIGDICKGCSAAWPSWATLVTEQA
jgi:hypothetical protein